MFFPIFIAHFALIPATEGGEEMTTPPAYHVASAAVSPSLVKRDRKIQKTTKKLSSHQRLLMTLPKDGGVSRQNMPLDSYTFVAKKQKKGEELSIKTLYGTETEKVRLKKKIPLRRKRKPFKKNSQNQENKLNNLALQVIQGDARQNRLQRGEETGRILGTKR